MAHELKIVKNWGLVYIVLMLLGTICEILLGFEFFVIVLTLVSISIYAFGLYVIFVKIKSQNIIIEQNKEIIKLLSK